jgi:hypothetical protein
MSHTLNIAAGLVAVAGLAMALLSTGRAGALAQVFPEYLVGVQIANLESTEAQVVLSLVDDNGTVIETTTDPIAAQDSRTYLPVSNVLGSGCAALADAVQGAGQTVESRFVFPRSGCVLVMASTQRLAAVANIVSADLRAGGSYLYERSGANTVYLPLLQKDNSGFTTWFTVQNLGAGPANVQVSYSDGAQAAASIARDRSQLFSQAQEAHPQPVFAATVTSDQPVFVSVIQENSRTIFAYSGFPAGAANPVFPLINANNNGYITGIQIQNTGLQTTTVEVTYTPSEVGAACTETQTIEAGSAKTFTLFAFDSGANSDCLAQQPFVGSGQVTGNSAGQLLVAVANQLLPGVSGGSYSSFNPAQASQNVVMPLVMDRNAGFFTGFSLQNVGAAAATVQCTFANNSYTISTTLQPGESFADIQQNKLAAGYVGSARCAADNAAAGIVAVVNELGSQIDADQLLVYEGVPNP